jgi:hypothetical protein
MPVPLYLGFPSTKNYGCVLDSFIILDCYERFELLVDPERKVARTVSSAGLLCPSVTLTF